MLLVCAPTCLVADLQAQETVPLKPAQTAPAERADSESGDLKLTPPVNSTLEIRVARKSWLLEKLTGPKKEPSVKMTPPSPPPAADPPSLGRPQLTKPLLIDSGDLGWRPRGEKTPAPSVRPNRSAENKMSVQPESTATQPETTNMDSSTAEQTPSDSPATADSNRVGDSNQVGDARTTQVTPQAIPDNYSPELAPPPMTEPRESADSDSSVEPPGKVDTLNVRELRIDLDGSPIPQKSVDSKKRPSKLGSAASGSVVTEVKETSPTSRPGRNELEDVAVGRAGDDFETSPPTVALDYTGYPKRSLQLSRSVRSMNNMIRACLRYYYARPENANERSNWGVMHSMMVYGGDTKIRTGNRTYNAIAWIAGNNACRGQKLLTLDNDRLTARSGIGLQGHQAQLLTVLSLCDVPFDYTLYADDQKFTVGDLIESEMLACRSGEELTFTLIGLAHYLDTDTVWRSEDGELWDFERLLREELSQPIVGAACGGTHRLMGYAHALRKRRAEGKPITGQWKRAQQYTNDFVKYAYRLQNRDGSMTTDWFEGREDNGDLDRKIQTTGHIVEWLLTVTPDSQLQDRRLVSAVRFLMKSMYEERDREWKIGPKGHALRSLAMFYERAYRSGPAWRSRSVAQNPQSRR
ncbi:MAG: hypothetical protein AAGI63_07320 [Planctomycetota bacterium]